MKNTKTEGLRNLQKGLVWLLAAILLITMLPLAGLAAGQAVQGNEPAFPAEFTAHAASYPTSGECGNSAKWSFNTKTGALTISGSGEMWDWEDPGDEAAEDIAPWIAYYYDSIRSVTINSGITALGDYTFAYCESVTSVSIPNTVKSIGEGTFFDCCSLKTINIPNSVTAIYDLAFAFCESLQNISVPAGVTTLASSAFTGCLTAKGIQIASGSTKFKTVDGVVFSKDGTTLLIYPSGKKDYIYHVPAGTALIGELAFLYNPSIRAISFPESTTEISSQAIVSNEKLLRIYIPASMENVRGTAVDECPAFTDVYYEGTELQRLNQLSIFVNNEQIDRAEWHYKTSPEDMLAALFEDVPKKAYYYRPVNWAAHTGVTTGTSDVTFSPDDVCTRGQAVTFLWRANGSEKVTDIENPFTDVKETSYYYDAVLWAVKNGVTNGMTDTTFEPNTKCNRGQIVTFLWRAEKEPESSTTVSFTDVAEGAFYYDAVRWAVENGVTNGMTDTTFEPNTKCSRGQIVTFLYRTQLQYTVSFDGNGGTVSGLESKKTVINGETYGTMPDAWREAYQFDGWYTEADGGTMVTDTTIVELEEDQTLYAHWAGRSYRITYDANGGSVVSSDDTWVTNGTPYGIMPIPTPLFAGCEFDGWYTEAMGGELISESTIVDVKKDQTLYAHWRLTGTITDSWEEIIGSINDGTYKNKYKIGDTKILDLGQEGIVEMQIAAFDADELEDGSGKAAVTWISKQLLNSGHAMNPVLEADPADSSKYINGTGSIGGWKNSEMRKWLQSEIKPLIPAEVQSAIKPVIKYSASNDPSENLTANEITIDDVWIPSSREIGEKRESSETKGPEYSGLFTSRTDRVKTKIGATAGSEWCLRSVDGWSSYWFRGVNSYGEFTANPASYEVVRGVALGFCM